MKDYLKKRFINFISSRIQWGSCIINVILCVCMAYFYYDSEIYAPLLYSIFFLSYIFVIFLFGEKLIPFMYVLYMLGSTQNITFINCTGFFITMFLSVLFPKQKMFLYGAYILDIFLVCFRHNKSIVHILCHISFCIVFYLFFEVIIDKLKSDFSKDMYSDFANAKNKIDAETNVKKLDIDKVDRDILTALSNGYKQKEIDGLCENAVSKRLKKMRERNEIETNAELLMKFIAEKENCI